MTATLTGGCACGKLRYACTAEPIVVYACHCADCQKRSGSAFGVSVRVPTEALTIEGAPRHHSRTADSGNTILTDFCGDCGTTILSYGDARPQMRVIMAGTLDDPSQVAIQANIWTNSAQPWVHLDQSLDNHPQGLPMPPSG